MKTIKSIALTVAVLLVAVPAFADVVDFTSLTSTFNSNYPGAVSVGLGIFTTIAIIVLVIRVIGKFGVRGTR